MEAPTVVPTLALMHVTMLGGQIMPGPYGENVVPLMGAGGNVNNSTGKI